MLLKNIRNPLTKLSVKQQLILVFIILAIPVFLFDWYANTKVEEMIKRNVTSAYVQLNNQHFQMINRDIDSMDRMMTTIILNPLTQNMAGNGDETVYKRVNEYQEMSKLLASYSMNVGGGESIYFSYYVYDPHSIYNFAPNQPHLGRAGVYFYSDENQATFIRGAIEKKGKGMLVLMDDEGQQVLSYVRAVNSVYRGNNIIGVLVATQIQKKIQNSMNSVTLPTNSEIYLVDLSDRILASTTYKNGNTIELPAEVGMGVGEFEDTKDKITKDFIYVVHSNFIQQQKLVYEIPIISLLQQQKELKSFIKLILIGYTVLGLVLIIYFWNSLMTPLQRLASFARSFAPGKKVPSRIESKRNDEVGVLINSVYDMTNRINVLIHDKYAMEIKQKEAQLKILYEQINPHLLYNTLESIYWKSSLEGHTESTEMIKDLSNLMRIGLSRGQELITVEKELEHAKAYISLEKKRYEYNFKIDWQIDEATFINLIPKITLQPLIENAIVHGVRNMDEDGEIVISTELKNGCIIVRIEDNGFKEVNYETINLLLNEKKPSSGYGLRNVHQRIHLHFGNEYGLSVQPRHGGGTVVIIRLPECKETP